MPSVPLDSETILSETRKTGRAVMIQDTATMGSVGSDVLALIASDKQTFSLLPRILRKTQSPTHRKVHKRS